MLLVGIAYLLVVGIMFWVLASRNRAFQRNEPAVTGTVVALGPPDAAGLRTVFRDRDTRVAVVRFTYRGTTREVPAEVDVDQHLRVGATVTLIVFQPGPQPDSGADVVVVRGQGLRELEAMPAVYLVGAGVVTWYLVFSLVQQGFGTRTRRREVPG